MSAQVKPRITIIVDLLKNHKGRFITTEHIDKKGHRRRITGRLESVTEEGMNHDPATFGHRVMHEKIDVRNPKGRFTKLGYMQYRQVNFNTLTKATFNGKTLIAREGMECVGKII